MASHGAGEIGGRWQDHIAGFVGGEGDPRLIEDRPVRARGRPHGERRPATIWTDRKAKDLVVARLIRRRLVVIGVVITVGPGTLRLEFYSRTSDHVASGVPDTPADLHHG